jgi:hypothetical protein
MFLHKEGYIEKVPIYTSRENLSYHLSKIEARSWEPYPIQRSYIQAAYPK